MKKIVISVLGYDRPGIVAAVAQFLFEQHCNIEDVSQTILQTEFAGIFIAAMPDRVAEQQLLAAMQEQLAPMGLSVFIKAVHSGTEWAVVESEPFVITTLGPDRLGLVAGITRLLADFGVNITNLKAAFRGGDDPHDNRMIYEVAIPVTTDLRKFRQALGERGAELGLTVSVQHRDIFESIHRV